MISKKYRSSSAPAVCECSYGSMPLADDVIHSRSVDCTLNPLTIGTVIPAGFTLTKVAINRQMVNISPSKRFTDGLVRENRKRRAVPCMSVYTLMHSHTQYWRTFDNVYYLAKQFHMHV